MNHWQTLNQRIADCELCPRLRKYCAAIGEEKRRSFQSETYWARPVPNLGRFPAPLLIVGLAPAAHGANRTGQMFTGDRSGEWLFRALHRAGFANQPVAKNRNDGFELIDCAITATCHCAPPDNKPNPNEIANCRPFLTQTFELAQPKVVVALGQIGWKAVVDSFRGVKQLDRMTKFGHRVATKCKDGIWLLASYHPSQQNTFTGKLTEAMLDAVFSDSKRMIAESTDEGRAAVPLSSLQSPKHSKRMIAESTDEGRAAAPV